MNSISTNKEKFNIIVSSENPVFYTNKLNIVSNNSDAISEKGIKKIVKIHTSHSQQDSVIGEATAIQCNIENITEEDPLLIKIHILVCFDYVNSNNEPIGYGKFSYHIRDNKFKLFILLYHLFKEFIAKNYDNEQILKEFSNFYNLNNKNIIHTDFMQMLDNLKTGDARNFIRNMVKKLNEFNLVRVKYKITDKYITENVNNNFTGRHIYHIRDLFNTIFIRNMSSVDNDLYYQLLGMIFGFAIGFKISDAVKPWAHMVKKNIVNEIIEKYNISLSFDVIWEKLKQLEYLFRIDLYDKYMENTSFSNFGYNMCNSGNKYCVINMLFQIINFILESTKLNLTSIYVPKITIYNNQLDWAMKLTTRQLKNFICTKNHDYKINEIDIPYTNEEKNNINLFTHINLSVSNDKKRVISIINDSAIDALKFKIFQVMQYVVHTIQLQYFETSNISNKTENTKYYKDDKEFNLYNDTNDLSIEFYCLMYITRLIPSLSVGNVISTLTNGSYKTNYENTALASEINEYCFINYNLINNSDIDNDNDNIN